MSLCKDWKGYSKGIVNRLPLMALFQFSFGSGLRGAGRACTVLQELPSSRVLSLSVPSPSNLWTGTTGTLDVQKQSTTKMKGGM